MQIKNLYIYPIKGCAGISLDNSFVDELGLRYDRRLMLVSNEDGRFLSQRSHPKMALIHTAIANEILFASHLGNGIEVNFAGHSHSKSKHVSVWNDAFTANMIDDSKVHQWFSDLLDVSCSLVAMPFSGARTRSNNLVANPFPMSFGDGYPILILGTASIENIDTLSPYKIDHTRFRPNIVIETKIAHEEDTWHSIIINEQVDIKAVNPCVRCQVINIDQTTGVSSIEPTKTLINYRKTQDGIIFGVNALAERYGTIHVGDTVKNRLRL